MELKIDIHEANSLYEAIEDRLEKDIDEQERNRLLKLRYRVEALIQEEKAAWTEK